MFLYLPGVSRLVVDQLLEVGWEVTSARVLVRLRKAGAFVLGPV